jgi:hypothetical protein
MQALFAGVLAWVIELGVAVLMLCLLRREENKVLQRRKKNG